MDMSFRFGPGYVENLGCSTFHPKLWGASLGDENAW